MSASKPNLAWRLRLEANAVEALRHPGISTVLREAADGLENLQANLESAIHCILVMGGQPAIDAFQAELAASAMSAGTAKAPKAVEGEARQRGPAKQETPE